MALDVLNNGDQGAEFRAKLNGNFAKVSAARPLTSFGVTPGVLVDQSSAINSALDSGEEIYIPPLDFYIGDGISLRAQTKITGSGPMRSRFVALPGATAPMLTISAGQIRYVTLRDICFQGQLANTGQKGIVIRGNIGGGSNGGLWDSLFENIRCRNVDGEQLVLLGATALDNTIPVQFVKFSKLDFERPYDTSKAVVYAHGQVEHITFDSCRLHGPASGAAYGGLNVYMGRAFGASGDVVGPYGTGTALSAVAPKSITMIECSVENADQGYILDSAENVSMLGGWFEQIKLNSILVQSSCRSITSQGQRFADAGTDATNGRAIRALSGSDITVSDPRFIGTNTTILSTDGSGSILPKGGGVGGGATSNVFWDVTVGSGTTQLDNGVNPGIFVSFSSSGISISRITSRLNPGELFTIKVKASSPNTATLSNSGTGGISNISLGSGTTLSLSPGSITTLRRSQQAHGWDLVSYNA